MDRGLCVVLTIITGAALGFVEACSGAAQAPGGHVGHSAGRAAASVHLVDPAQDVVTMLGDLDLVLEDRLDRA